MFAQYVFPGYVQQPQRQTLITYLHPYKPYKPFSLLNLSHASFNVLNTALEIILCSVVASVEIYTVKSAIMFII
jgi:hypothetical protein